MRRRHWIPLAVFGCGAFLVAFPFVMVKLTMPPLDENDPRYGGYELVCLHVSGERIYREKMTGRLYVGQWNYFAPGVSAAELCR